MDLGGILKRKLEAAIWLRLQRASCSSSDEQQLMQINWGLTNATDSSKIQLFLTII